MMYAFTEAGDRIQATNGASGFCQCCNVQLVPRCVRLGAKYVPHWAHQPKRHCDPWWETETPWHRNWKALFPERFREVVHFDEPTGEKHIADIKTDDGCVLEFQNSPIEPAEARSREVFYRCLVWIVNAEKFRQSFCILDPLPDPEAQFAQDIVFVEQRAKCFGRGFWRLSENAGAIPGDGNLRLMHEYDEITEEIRSSYIGHHLFDWKRPRSVWFETKKPVYLDFGTDVPLPMIRRGILGHSPLCVEYASDALLELKVYRRYGDCPLWCAKYISKREFITKHGGSLPPNK